MLVGTIVKLKKECLNNPQNAKGVCIEVYKRDSEGEGVSLLFENGKSDGFSPEEQKEIIIPIGISEDLMNYKFENVERLNEDFGKGLFNKVLGIPH